MVEIGQGVRGATVSLPATASHCLRRAGRAAPCDGERKLPAKGRSARAHPRPHGVRGCAPSAGRSPRRRWRLRQGSLSYSAGPWYSCSSPDRHPGSGAPVITRSPLSSMRCTSSRRSPNSSKNEARFGRSDVVTDDESVPSHAGILCDRAACRFVVCEPAPLSCQTCQHAVRVDQATSPSRSCPGWW